MVKAGWMVLVALVVLGLLGAGRGDGGESVARGFVFEEIEVGGATYRYGVYVPRGYEADGSWPLVVFLHGRGESGTDGQRPMAMGLGPRVLWNPEMYPGVILFPQKPSGTEEWEAHAAAVGAMMERAMGAYSIDRDRVYLTGMSQGGHGVWSINAAMPGVFAALVPVCGYVEAREGAGIGNRWVLDLEGETFDRLASAASAVPVWAFHGARDDVVPAAHTEAMVEGIRARGGDARVTIYPEANHNSWDAAYGNAAMSAWLFERRR